MPTHKGYMFATAVRAFTLIAAVSLMAVPPARAAVQLEVGLWQDVETGKDNDKMTKPEVHATCMSSQEARNPVKTSRRTPRARNATSTTSRRAATQ